MRNDLLIACANGAGVVAGTGNAVSVLDGDEVDTLGRDVHLGRYSRPHHYVLLQDFPECPDYIFVHLGRLPFPCHLVRYTVISG